LTTKAFCDRIKERREEIMATYRIYTKNGKFTVEAEAGPETLERLKRQFPEAVAIYRYTAVREVDNG
jgi:hypothetical protein